MRTGHFAKLLSAVSLLAAAIPADASTITINWTVDLSTASFSNSQVFSSGNFGPVQVSGGDTIDLTLTFANNQALQITNLGNFYTVPFDLAGIGQHSAVGTATLLNATGVNTPSVAVNYTGCCHHLGPLLNGASFGSGTFAFTGLHTVMTVTGFGTAQLGYREMNFFGANGQQTTYAGGGGNAVPEPATLALLGGGMLGIAGLRRKAAKRAA